MASPASRNRAGQSAAQDAEPDLVFIGLVVRVGAALLVRIPQILEHPASGLDEPSRDWVLAAENSILP